MTDVYINKISSYFPNSIVNNNEMEEYLGYIDGKPSRSRPIVSISLDKIIFASIGEIPRTTSGKIKRHAALVLHNFDLLEPKYVHSFS